MLRRVASNKAPTQPDRLLLGARAFRAGRPSEIGPLIAGLGAAAVLYGTRLLLQAASNPKFTEAVRDAAAGAAEAPRKAAEAAAATAAAARGRTASEPAGAASAYYTTDVMGIDLGQGAKEWSAAYAAVVEAGEARVVENEQGSRSTPALVAFLDNGETLVGTPAKNFVFSRTATAVYSPQLLFGLTYDSPECASLLEAAALPFEVAEGTAGAAVVRIHGAEHPPAEIAARGEAGRIRTNVTSTKRRPPESAVAICCSAAHSWTDARLVGSPQCSPG